MLGYCIGWTLPVLAAYPWVAWCDRDGRSVAATFCLRLALSFAVGMAVASCAYFLMLLYIGPPKTLYCISESASFLVIAGFGFAIKWRCSEKKPENTLPSTAQRNWLPAAFWVAAFLAALYCVGRFQKFPAGDWDAWSMWNYRAKMFALGESHWRNAFAPEVPHNDYPLLLSSMNGRLWTYFAACASREAPLSADSMPNALPAWSPWLVACMFSFGAVVLATAAVARLCGSTQGFLAGLTLLGTVPFFRESTRQFADVPLAFFALAAVVPLALNIASPRPNLRLTILSGLSAGAAAWTKNEGLMMAAALAVATLGVGWLTHGFKTSVREFAVWLFALAVPLGIVLMQKTNISWSNDLAADQNIRAVASRFFDWTRQIQVFVAFGATICQGTKPAIVVVPLLFWCLGVSKRSSLAFRAAWLPLAFVVFALSGYYLVCITTPNNLRWQLDAVPRLIAHLWPTATVCIFLFLRTPEGGSRE